jgi:hypothetical protein
MNAILLSNKYKNFLSKQGTEKERYRLGWTGSILASYPSKKLKTHKAARLLLALKKRLSDLFDTPNSDALTLPTFPRLPQPKNSLHTTVRPPLYFSKGTAELDKRNNPDPILYLLTETNETAQARPVPGNLGLLHSLCKGKGTLKRTKQGLVFLDIDDRFISTLLPYLKGHKLNPPPYFSLFSFPEGAHIPVIPAREAAFQYLNQIEEIEQEFSFEVEGLFSIEPVTWPEVEQVWFFKIRSESLEKLRQKYFLPSTPAGHPFHITVAIKPRLITTKSAPLMRINPAFIAA